MIALSPERVPSAFDKVEVIFGAAALGMLIGSLVRVALRQMKKLDAKLLVPLMVGAGVIGFFRAISAQQLPDDIYFYPMGLLLGYVFTAAIERDDQPGVSPP